MCTMDEEIDYVSDSGSETLSDSEKYKNYLEIANGIRYIENGGRITEDWMEESKLVIAKWRSWISDFSTVNPDREDKEFRDAATQCEVAMTYLCKEIAENSYVDVNMYANLLISMKKMCDCIFSDDELDDLMKMMSM